MHPRVWRWVMHFMIKSKLLRSIAGSLKFLCIWSMDSTLEGMIYVGTWARHHTLSSNAQICQTKRCCRMKTHAYYVMNLGGRSLDVKLNKWRFLPIIVVICVSNFCSSYYSMQEVVCLGRRSLILQEWTSFGVGDSWGWSYYSRS